MILVIFYCEADYADLRNGKCLLYNTHTTSYQICIFQEPVLKASNTADLNMLRYNKRYCTNCMKSLTGNLTSFVDTRRAHNQNICMFPAHNLPLWFVALRGVGTMSGISYGIAMTDVSVPLLPSICEEKSDKSLHFL